MKRTSIVFDRLYSYEENKTLLLLQGKSYLTVKQPRFPYRTLLRKLEDWTLTAPEFVRLMNRIDLLKKNNGHLTKSR